MRVERHPKLNIWVREDGCIYLPQSGPNNAHWTFGCKNSTGYRHVKVGGKNYRVHRLVVGAFIQYPIPKGMEVDHINRRKDDNRVDNLRIVTSSENSRNTSYHDRVDARGGIHKYEDEKQYAREQNEHYRQAKCKTHKRVRFANGTKLWIPLPEADAYLIIPLKERYYGM